jgi:hypothetical protein
MVKRTRLRRTVLITVVVVIGLYLWWFYPWFYMAEDIEGWVVDAHSGEPIEGVVVTANWELKRGTLGGDIPCGQAHVDEAVTDPAGHFYFARWGPKIRPIGCEIVFQDPQLLLFKSGYKFRRLQNAVRSVWNRGVVRRSQWNAKTVQLDLFEGTIGAYEDNFESFNRELEGIAILQPEECFWRKLPKAIHAVHQERNRLIQKGVPSNTLYSVDSELLINHAYYTKKGGCGSPKEFFEELWR